jgi:hypothetical protein
VEHLERQEEREREIGRQTDELDEQGERMDKGTDELQQRVDDVREDFERKRQSEDVPGAQPPGAHGEGDPPPEEADIAPGDEE